MVRRPLPYFFEVIKLVVQAVTFEPIFVVFEIHQVHAHHFVVVTRLLDQQINLIRLETRKFIADQLPKFLIVGFWKFHVLNRDFCRQVPQLAKSWGLIFSGTFPLVPFFGPVRGHKVNRTIGSSHDILHELKEIAVHPLGVVQKNNHRPTLRQRH